MSLTRRIAIGLLAGIVTTILYGLILFGCAGRFDLPVYWVYLAIMVLVSFVGFAVIDPDLIRERSKPGPGGKDFLTVYLGKSVLTLHFVLSPLDVGRFHFSDTIPVWIQWTGLLGFAIGIGLTITCMAINRYFSSVVRIQTERGHELITTGPYALVRHPGYTGILLLSLGSGLALGSWWGGVPALVFVLMIFRRLLIEDAFLLREFDGYVEYARRVRFRLVPFIW